MKGIVKVVFFALAFASCKKEEPAPATPTTPTPTPAPTTATRAFAINASSGAFGGITYGQLYVYLDGNQINQTNGGNDQIGTPTGMPGCVYYNFTIGTTYHMELAVGSSYQYKADVVFDASGNMTDSNLNPGNTVSWVNSTAPNNPILFQ